MNKVFPIVTGEDAKKVQQALEEAKHPKEGTIQCELLLLIEVGASIKSFTRLS